MPNLSHTKSVRFAVICHWRSADLDETGQAIQFFEQHLTIARELGDRRGEGKALGHLGNAYLKLGETRRGIQFYEQQLAIVREIGYRRGEGVALGNLGRAYFRLSLALDQLGDRPQAIHIPEISALASAVANLTRMRTQRISHCFSCGLSFGSDGISQRNKAVATKAPAS